MLLDGIPETEPDGRTAFDLISSEMEDAATTLGAGVWRTTVRVTLPLTITLLVTAILALVLAAAMVAFSLANVR